ncbi:MAG: hypothetical protein OXR73_10260 [Myxococcales bacterium]|nr:hypothetical protein [Myxococcales bacterium]
MTTSGRLWLLLLLSSAWPAGSCASQLEARRGDALDVSGYPPDVQAAYDVFAVRCSRCHTLARPFNARITEDAHWIRYVARMRLQPASGINQKNGEIILKFLLFYTAELRRQEASEGAPPDIPRPPESPGWTDSEPEPPTRQVDAGVVEPAPPGETGVDSGAPSSDTAPTSPPAPALGRDS